MAKAGYNERKAQILDYFCHGKTATSTKLSSALGISLGNASELLRRYQKQGFLARHRDQHKGGPPKAFIYRLPPTFEKAKEETYSLFDDRCQQLLSDFLEEKDERVCSKCSQSCTQGEKIHRGLRNLIETLTIEAATRCDNKVDRLVCLLAPHLSSADLVSSVAKGKGMNSLAREMGKSTERLLTIIRRKEKKIELQRH